MKQNLYLFILAALLGLGGTQTWAQSLTTTEIDGTEFYNIGNADELATFATIVKDGELGANAVLTADIALSSAWGTPIGTPGGAYSGIFDGKGHKITGFEGEFSSDGGGLFGHTNGATIMNFSIDGVLTATAGTGSGVVGYPTSSYIANVHSTLDIFVPVNGVHHVGGVVGSARGGNVISGCTFAGNMSVAAGSTDNFAGVVAYLGGDSVAFCANYGTITFDDVNCAAGGVAGYLNNTGSYVLGCLNMGALVCSEPEATPKWGGAIVGRLRTHDVNKLTGNCWLEGSATGAGKDNDGKVNLTTASCFPAEQLATGQVCYLLNGNQAVIGWYQTLGTDPQPVLDATHAQVYMNGRLHCNGVAYEGAVYSNENAGVVQDEHDIVDGEQGGVVEQCAVDATAVGSLDVYIFNIARAKRFLVDEVGQTSGILHLRQSDDGASHARKHVGAHIGQCPRHVLQFMAILQPSPPVAARGQVLKVSLPLVVAGVEEVFLVVEAHGIDRELLLCRC